MRIRLPIVRMPIGTQMLAIAVAALACAGLAMVLNPPRPRAVVAAVFDFGTLPQFTEIRHTWVVANDGTAPLRIRFGGLSCPVSMARPNAKETITVPPGGKTPIEAHFNTKRWSGKHRSMARILTDDPENPRIDLSFEGIVQPAADAGEMGTP